MGRRAPFVVIDEFASFARRTLSLGTALVVPAMDDKRRQPAPVVPGAASGNRAQRRAASARGRKA